MVVYTIEDTFNGTYIGLRTRSMVHRTEDTFNGT